MKQRNFLVGLGCLFLCGTALTQTTFAKEEDFGINHNDKIKETNLQTIDQLSEEIQDRGLVAIDLSGDAGAEVSETGGEKGISLSWRSLTKDPSDTTFAIYRNQELIADRIKLTNFIDEKGKASDSYKVIGSSDESLGIEAKDTAVWENQFLELSLFKPENQVMPDGSETFYTANDLSLGDLDGDGENELIVKWYPSNAQDNSQDGYTGNTFLDGYDVDYETGEVSLLWRIDLGVNIRSGAHYTQFQVWDYDGDGIAEIAVKTADGSTTYQSKTGDDSKLEETGYVGAVNSDALPTDKISDAHDYRDEKGRVLDGPEMFTMFKGDTGEIIDTVDYTPERGKVSDWGDDYGNRVDRFLSGTAYLDGKDPYAIFTRGYYTRTVMAAYHLDDTDGDGKGDTIREHWVYDTNEDTSGQKVEGQGNHALSINDVDGDGKDEIIFGSMVINSDGSLRYTTELGHGDAMHVGDWLPERPGLEIMKVQEEKDAKIHALIQDAATGEILMGYHTGKDTGRGLVADIDPRYQGAEFWSSSQNDQTKTPGVYTSESTLDNLIRISDKVPSINFSTYWDGDLLNELQDHTFNNDDYLPQTFELTKWDYQNAEMKPIFSSSEIWTNNGTKGNAGLMVDLLGDWREEVITRAAGDPNGGPSENDHKLRIYSTTIPTDYVIPTMMENATYRKGIAWQNVGYNQPAHTNYLLSEGVQTAKITVDEVTADKVALSFTEASDGVNGYDVQGYQIWRTEKGSADSQIVDQISNEALEKNGTGFVYIDQTVQAETEYDYSVTAIVNGRSSYRSQIVSVQTQAAVEVESISLNATGIKTLKKGTEFQLETNVTPEGADVGTLHYASNRPEIASVDDKGKVEALKAGTTKISVTTDNGKTASFTLRVTK